MSKAILIFLFFVAVFDFSSVFTIAEVLKRNIKESRHREELLYKEVKNLDYEISVLTELQRNMK